MNSYERIYAVVRSLPRGTVATSGQVARLAGNPRWARVVGYALHVNPDPEGIPCYRVVDREAAVRPAPSPSAAAIFRKRLLEARRHSLPARRASRPLRLPMEPRSGNLIIRAGNEVKNL